MKVQCVLCDRFETIPDESFEAKKLKNRPIHTYMCADCNKRIREKTEKRLATGKFRFYRTSPYKPLF